MAQTTSWFGWSQLDKGTQPFYAAFDALVGQIDTTVHSLAGGQFKPRLTVVFSGTPTAKSQIALNTDPAAGTWVTMSNAPMGAYTGTFTVDESGMAIRFEMTTSMLMKENAHSSYPISSMVFFRLLEAGGSVLVPGSAWVDFMGLSDEWVSPKFVYVTSLGTGTYSVSIQLRGGAASASDLVFVSSASVTQLLARVVPRGT